MIGVFYKSKKEMKEHIGEKLEYIETSMFGPQYQSNGSFAVVGPDPYTNRKYFAEVTIKNDLIIRVQ